MLNLNSSPKREFPECLLDIMYYSSNPHTIYYDWSHHHLLFINLSQTPILQNLVNSVCLTISLEFLGGTFIELNTSLLVAHFLILSEFFFLHFASHFSLRTSLLDRDPISSFPEVPLNTRLRKWQIPALFKSEIIKL